MLWDKTHQRRKILPERFDPALPLFLDAPPDRDELPVRQAARKYAADHLRSTTAAERCDDLSDPALPAPLKIAFLVERT